MALIACDERPFSFSIVGKLDTVPVYRQNKLITTDALPFAVRPNKEGEQLGSAQLATLRFQLLLKPVAVGFVLAHRSTGKELKSIPVAAMLIGRFDQMQDLRLEPFARHVWWTGMGWNNLVPCLVRSKLATNGYLRQLIVVWGQQLEGNIAQAPSPGTMGHRFVLRRTFI